MNSENAIPIVDISPLAAGDEHAGVATELAHACRDHGFFYIVGHGIDSSLPATLERLSRAFFAQNDEAKQSLRMELGGRAWRGYFPVGNELTSGKPDEKEGLYFGAELEAAHPKVRDKVPLHGGNLFPEIAGFRESLLEYLAQMTQLGHTLMRGLALSLNLEPNYFHERYTHDPLILFRIFHYPPLPRSGSRAQAWSVGEHTDYGLLTILRQDNSGGLQIKSKSRWIDALPIKDSFVCNLGDMLERMTAGLYRSTPHRVRNAGQRGRLSFPFFFDPNFDVKVKPIANCMATSASHEPRWDGEDLHAFSGTYGDYLLSKVARVFPELSRSTSADPP